jgi:hypothetical protein
MSSDSPQPDSTTDDQVMLVTWLSTHDARCPACKYNLRNLTQARCPECGLRISLSIVANEPHLRLWIATTILLCTDAGLGIFVLMYLIRTFLDNLDVLHPELSEGVMELFFLATIPFATACLLLRRRFTRLKRSIQLSLLAITALMTLLEVVTLFIHLR